MCFGRWLVVDVIGCSLNIFISIPAVTLRYVTSPITLLRLPLSQKVILGNFSKQARIILVRLMFWGQTDS